MISDDLPSAPVSAHLPEPPPLQELLARGPVALFLDFDGTLVAIAAGPDDIHVPDGLADALRALHNKLSGRLALVSGRALGNLAQHLGALPIAQAGSHGAHIRLADGSVAGNAPQSLASAIITALSDFADTHDGVSQERKDHGGALHYRANPAAEARRGRFHAKSGQHARFSHKARQMRGRTGSSRRG